MSPTIEHCVRMRLCRALAIFQRKQVHLVVVSRYQTELDPLFSIELDLTVDDANVFTTFQSYRLLGCTCDANKNGHLACLFSCLTTVTYVSTHYC